MPSPPVDMGKANVAEAVSTGHTSCPRCCWCLRRVEHVGVCPNRILPKMSDFPGQTGPTRHSNLRNRRPTKPGGHRQTARSASEQQLHARDFTRWYNARCRELEREAEQRKLEREQVLLTPLHAFKPTGVYSDWEKLKLEFATLLPSKYDSLAGASLLQRGSWQEIDNSATQRFVVEVQPKVHASRLIRL